jgi:hypothetical protein
MSKHISTKTKWVSTDGWRGYSEPINAVGGCNHTGSFSDSPCPTNVVKTEIENFRKKLRQNKIRSKLLVTQSSNIFCQHVYVLVHPDDRQRGLVISKQHQDETRLFYSC